MSLISSPQNIERIPAIDVAKAIGILLMILGHCEVPWSVRKLISSFHMPLFLIFSGFFFRDQDISITLSKGWKHLLKPYLITSSFFILLLLASQNYSEALKLLGGVLLGAGDGHFFHHSVPIIGPIWFLLALFWCKFFYGLLYKKTRHYFLISFLISIFSFIFGKYVSGLPFGLLYGGCSLVFFSMGHMWKQKGTVLENKFCLLAGIIVWILSDLYDGHFGIADYSCCLYPISILAAFVGTYVTFLISKAICLLPHYFYRILEWLGKNTLLILCYHTLCWAIWNCMEIYLFIPRGIDSHQGLWLDLSIVYSLSLGLPAIHLIIRDKVLPKIRQNSIL